MLKFHLVTWKDLYAATLKVAIQLNSSSLTSLMPKYENKVFSVPPPELHWWYDEERFATAFRPSCWQIKLTEL